MCFFMKKIWFSQILHYSSKLLLFFGLCTNNNKVSNSNIPLPCQIWAWLIKNKPSIPKNVKLPFWCNFEIFWQKNDHSSKMVIFLVLRCHNSKKIYSNFLLPYEFWQFFTENCHHGAQKIINCHFGVFLSIFIPKMGS